MILNLANGKNLKIIFNPVSESLLIGDLVKIVEKNNTGVIAQIVNIESINANDINHFAKAKILFSTNNNVKIEWMGNIPSKDSIIAKISAEELFFYTNENMENNSIHLGKLPLFKNECNYVLFDKLKYPTAAFYDNNAQNVALTEYLTKEFLNNSLKTVLFDFRGEYLDLPNAVRLEVGKDLKLPLNSYGIDLIYQNLLNNLSLESKAVIEDIFMEIQDYADSCEQGYIPFSNFIKVVEDEYQNNKTTELTILKNSLVKLGKQGIYANDGFEIEALKLYIEKCDLIVLDFSTINSIWHKAFVEYVITANSINKQQFFLIMEMKKNDFNYNLIDKLFIEGVHNGIVPIITLEYNSEFVENVLSFAKNLIFYPSKNNIEILSKLNSLINKLNDSEILLYGELTSKIPLLANISCDDSQNVFSKTDLPVFSSSNIDNQQPAIEAPYVELDKSDNINEQNYQQELNNQEDDNFDFYQDTFEEEPIDETLEVPNNHIKANDVKEISPDDNSYENFDEIYNPQGSNSLNENIEFQNSENTDIPIYSAEDDQTQNNTQDEFNQGDVVYHQKYGQGTIKKIISYGNKCLFSINFDKFGKKLLDPELAVIEKV